MQKQILLVDNELKIVEHILENTDWDIEVLITYQKNNKFVGNSRIKKIYGEIDFIRNNNLEELDYKDFDLLWRAQLKVEDTYNRGLQDYQLGKYHFYRGYALVKQIFCENHFDAIIVKGLNHGYIWDRLITDYATIKNIRSYNIEFALASTRTVYDNYCEKLLPITKKGNAQIEDSVFPVMKEDGIERIQGNGGWSGVYRVVYQVFGELGLDIVKCIRYKNFGKNIWGISIIDRIKSFITLKKIKKYYDSIAVDLDKDKKYISYSLHLEPEANITGRAKMESQLVAIQMIASNLPSGWVVYVKEHPLQFILNRSRVFYAQLYSMSVYKTKRFYEEIAKMENVQILKLDIDNKMIIENCRAVASISGSVLTEATRYKKPALVFAADRLLYKISKGFFNISSYDDCRKAIEQIQNIDEVFYEDYEENYKKYMIDFTNEFQGYKMAVEVIKEELLRLDVENI